MIRPEDVVVVPLPTWNTEVSDRLAEYTANTWQVNRTSQERSADTNVGKLAELALRRFLLQQTDARMSIAFYDDFRTDDYRLHAPLDFICGETARVTEAIQILTTRKHPGAPLTVREREQLQQNEVMTGEIKATRIGARHRSSEGTVLIPRILGDDFLAYPHALRRDTIGIRNAQDYLTYVGRQSGEDRLQIIEDERDNMADWYFRVYIDELKKTAYILGGCSKDLFVDKLTVKHMAQAHKSEDALYLTVPLTRGTPIREFVTAYLAEPEIYEGMAL